MRNEKERLASLTHFSFEDLVLLVAVLRSEEGCSWDREQTHASLRACMVEEAYEVCEGIDQDDPAILTEELGDVLLQVIFHADIGKKSGRFTMEEILDGVCRKMIRRHPHVFEENGSADSWEEIKRKEKGTRTAKERLNRISRAFPSLTRARKFLEQGVKSPVEAEIPQSKEEAGEALFALTEACRQNGIDAEDALNEYLNRLL